MITKRLSIVFASVLLTLFAVLSVSSAVRESLTFDEIVAVEAGLAAWRAHDFSIDTNVPPLTRELAVLPALLGFTVSSPYPNIRELPARMVIIMLGVVLGLAIYSTAQLYFGSDVAVCVLFLYVFEPNILANNHYITQDIGVTLFFFLAYQSLVRVLKNPSGYTFFLHGLFVGFMASSKIPAVPFYFVSAVLLTSFLLRRQIFIWFWKYKLHICLSAMVCLFIVWSTYFFKVNVIVSPDGNTGRVSAKLMRWAVQRDNQMVKEIVYGLQTIRVPLGDYIAIIKNAAVRSTISKPIFFLGAFYTNTLWHFMVVNVLLKMPWPLTILFLFSLLFGYRNMKMRSTMIVLGIPIVSVFIVSIVTKMQPLVRYALPMYPFLILISASMLTYCKATYQKIFLLLLCLWYVWGTVSMFPHYISFANELAGPGTTSVIKFTDSNMDWGQSLPDLKRYIDTEKPSKLSFSYFGRDDAGAYGFLSDFPFGSYKFNEICAFHEIIYPANTGPSIVAISVSNWYGCGYNLDPKFRKNNIHSFVGGSILVFNE